MMLYDMYESINIVAEIILLALVKSYLIKNLLKLVKAY